MFRNRNFQTIAQINDIKWSKQSYTIRKFLRVIKTLCQMQIEMQIKPAFEVWNYTKKLEMVVPRDIENLRKHGNQINDNETQQQYYKCEYLYLFSLT